MMSNLIPSRHQWDLKVRYSPERYHHYLFNSENVNLIFSAVFQSAGNLWGLSNCRPNSSRDAGIRGQSGYQR